MKVEVQGRKVSYLLAERTVRVAEGFRMREVRRLHSMANPRSNRALAGLCEVLSDTQTRYPGTDLTLVYVPPRAEIPPR